MKALKLILVFVAILGGVFGVLWIVKDGSDPGGDGPDKTPIEQYIDQNKNDWENKGDWSDSLFNAHCDIINMLKKQGYKVGTLRDQNTSLAIKAVDKNIFKEWNSATCRKAVIDNYVKALNTIKAKDQSAANNPTVQKIRSVNATYNQAYALAHKSLGLSPGFNGSSWASISNYCNNIISQRNAIQSNANYKQYLSNIKDIKDGLNAINSKLDNAKKNFYNTLANQIVNYYSRIAPANRTKSQLNELLSARNRYHDEAGSNANFTNLKNFCSRFEDDVYNNN